MKQAFQRQENLLIRRFINTDSIYSQNHFRVIPQRYEPPMKTTFVLTIIGPDRHGIVNELSGILKQHNANWLASRMANLAGEFAGILHADVDEQHYSALLRDLNKLNDSNLQLLIKPVSTDITQKLDYRQAELEVVGTDREGIVKDITQALSLFDINVEELTTECSDAPMSSAPLFKAVAQLTIERSVDLELVQEEIEKIANDLITEFKVSV